jgi:amino acid transporter
MVIFVAYEGFELIANSAEDVREPDRTLPRAFGLSVGVVTVLYVVVAAITVSAVPEDKIREAKDYALAVAAEPSLGRTGFVLVAAAAVLATLSAINATVYGNARLGYILARFGELPGIEGRGRHDVPVDGVLTVAAGGLVLANLVPLASIAIIGSASFLLVFALANAAAVRTAGDIGARPALVWTALCATVVALGVLLWHSATTDLSALAVFVGFVALAVLFEYLYGQRVRGHFLGRRYDGSLS